jgi:hypothetical protein
LEDSGWIGHRSIESTLRYERCRLPSGALSPLDGVNEDRREPVPSSQLGRPAEALFEEPLDPAALLGQDSWLDEVRALYLALKTQLKGRFLALRGARAGPG